MAYDAAYTGKQWKRFNSLICSYTLFFKAAIGKLHCSPWKIVDFCLSCHWTVKSTQTSGSDQNKYLWDLTKLIWTMYITLLSLLETWLAQHLVTEPPIFRMKFLSKFSSFWKIRSSKHHSTQKPLWFSTIN